MQRISRAPELSATLSLDSCWITIASLGPLEHLDEAPALRLGKRPGLDDPHDVALVCLVALVVGVQGPRPADHLFVAPVAPDDVDPHSYRLLPFAGDDDALAHLGRIGCA